MSNSLLTLVSLSCTSRDDVFLTSFYIPHGMDSCGCYFWCVRSIYVGMNHLLQNAPVMRETLKVLCDGHVFLDTYDAL